MSAYNQTPNHFVRLYKASGYSLAGLRILMVGSWILVMIVELLNSAVEATVDRIGSERHELSGRAKDIGSAAVMLSVLLSAFTWLAILLF